MTTKQGDFLLLNFTLKVKESGETVDTTYDTVAKNAHLHREDSIYKPRFIILGEGSMPKGLEDSLVGLTPGEETTVELAPDKGFGARDPSKIRLVPLRRFREKGVDPVPGRQIELDGRPATVRAVGAGRVQLDYNHPLAGRTLIYDVSIEKVLDDEKDKILNIISRRLPEVDSSKFTLNKTEDELSIEVPEEAFYLSGLQVAKKSVISDLQKYLPELDTISFREVFKRTEPKPEKSPETKTEGITEPKQKTREPEKEASEARRKSPSAKSPRKLATTGARKRAKMGSESQR
ncbi:MAG TPA: FKBP-type peptidyl-prolyl cis-trans isomerase [Candidatus Bathyarchaeia archaeon]|nr:FKBP-type peptidyl-prolyl cis-trans isomerase [Candidatus Bathyarchaeia archaeon]